MADVRDLFYHGIREQVRTVLVALGPERIEKGLTAFEDGASNWSNCFFARAVAGQCDLHKGDPEKTLQKLLKLDSHMPVRITYNLFDGMADYHGMKGISMSKDELKTFIQGFIEEPSDPAVKAAINQLIATTWVEEPKAWEACT